MPEETFHSTPFEFRFSKSDKGVFSGLASTFDGKPDSFGTTFIHGAFAQSLRDHKAAGTKPAMLFSHKVDAPIGTWTAIKETAKGLSVTGKLTLGTKAADESFLLMRDGALGLSVAGRSKLSTVLDNGVIAIEQFQLSEISLVSLPSNTAAKITSVRSLPASIREFEALLKSSGFSRREAQRIATMGFNQHGEPEITMQDLDDLEARLSNQFRIAEKVYVHFTELRRAQLGEFRKSHEDIDGKS